MDTKKLYVGNLPWSMSDTSLREIFSQFGEIVEVVVISDRMTGRSKGFGFVTFGTEEQAAEAMKEMNEKDIEGRKLIVTVAKPQEKRTGGTGGFRDDRRRSY